MGIQLSDSVEKIVEKEKIASHTQFLLFPQCFKSCALLMRTNKYLWSTGLQDNKSGISNLKKKLDTSMAVRGYK